MIVMDFQNYYTNGKSSKSSTQNTIEATNEIIKTADPNHVIYLNRIHKLLNLSVSLIKIMLKE